MASEEIKSKANIGSSSLILIFIVLCLATFGLLSLSSAKNDWNLARKNAESVKGYYEADGRGEEFVKHTDEILSRVLSANDDVDTCMLNLKEELGDSYEQETGRIVTEIPMNYGQALHLELAVVCDRDVRYEIAQWKVINKEDYQIDDSMPVWDGQSDLTAQ